MPEVVVDHERAQPDSVRGRGDRGQSRERRPESADVIGRVHDVEPRSLRGLNPGDQTIEGFVAELISEPERPHHPNARAARRRTRRRRRNQAADTGGRRSTHGAAASSWEASRISTSSRPNGAANCTPIGRPSVLVPSGSEIAGCPVALNGSV